MKIKFLKFLTISTLVLPMILFFHTGFLSDSFIKNFQVVVFAIIFGFVIVWPLYRKQIFLASLVLLIGMVILSVANIMEWADMMGSTGVGFITINLVSYLPQMIKLGYIKKL